MKLGYVMCAALVVVAGATGCKTTTSAETAPAKEAPAKTEKAVKQAPPIPAGSPLAKVKMGMSRAQVDDLIGQPTSTRIFPSGKQFIPFYYGPDRVRTGAFYKGVGRIVFSGADMVVEIEHDPTEDGY